MKLYDPEETARVEEAKAKTWGRWAKVPRGRVLHWFPTMDKGVALCGATPAVFPTNFAVKRCPKCNTFLTSAQYIAGIRQAGPELKANKPWEDPEYKPPNWKALNNDKEE